MLAGDVQAVLNHYALAGGAVHAIQPLANAGGWSGSRIWPISDAVGNKLCLRQWPQEHPTVERLRLIHAVLGLVSFEMPVVAFPLRTTQGATYVEEGEHLWELTHWLPGTADYHANPNRARLTAAMRVLARFHDLAKRYKWRTAPAPSIEDRQRRIKGMRAKGLSVIEQSLGTPLGNEIDDRAARLLTVAGKALQRQSLAEALAAAPQLVLQPAIRDVHHEHVLFTGDEVTGLIDFGALRIDTPLVDVARLVGSLVGDDQESRRFALDAYSELRPLSEADCRLIDVLDESGLVLGALNWLIWLYGERRDMGPVGPIVERIEHILLRLENRGLRG
jgi:Ser/Thr protein kinase RdoA (MazF antagonist)